MIMRSALLFGAAVSFAAYLALANARRLARVSEFASRIPRSSLAVFFAFALVATLCAQKSGTNAPPRGSVEWRVESVELRDGQSHNSTLSTFNSQFRLDSGFTLRLN